MASLPLSSTAVNDASQVERIDVTSFRKADDLAAGLEFFVVVKSQDQEERRRRMLKSLRSGTIGRVAQRPVAEGLLLRGAFKSGRFEPSVVRTFREPRHIVPLHEAGFLLTEVNRLIHVDRNGHTVRSYTYPYFSYLHSVALSANGRSALLASSGYDSLIEIDLASGEVIWHWFAWEHGFNPDEEGVWLAATLEAQKAYEAAGKAAMMIHPDAYGEQGLLVARRSAHPNCAVFEDDTNQSVICSIGAQGKVYRISKATGETEVIIDWLSSMPHGLQSHNGQWIVTNTTEGEFWVLDRNFHPFKCYEFSSLGGRVEGSGSSEWLQQVVPISRDKYVAIDSNRSIFFIDLQQKAYSSYDIDGSYCVQDILPLS